MGESQRARWEETTLNTDCAAAATADLLLAASTTTVVALATTARPQRSHTAATVACTAAAFSALLLNLPKRSRPGRTLRLAASEAGLAEMPQAHRPPTPRHPPMLLLVKLKRFN